MYPNPFPFTLYNVTAETPTPPSPTGDYCYGGDWVQGKIDNYGMEFDGTDEYITTPSVSDIEFGNDSTFTVAFWVKSAQGSFQGFIGKRVFNLANYGWTIGRDFGVLSNDNKVYVTVSNGAGQYGYIFSDAVMDAEWHHIAFTRDGATPGNTILYIDGVAQADTTMAGGSGTSAQQSQLADGGQPLYVGRYWHTTQGTGYNLNGTIDDIGIWDVVLPASTISELYNSGVGKRVDAVVPPTSSGDYVDGILGNYALSFDSDDSPANYIDINNFSDIHALPSGSISMWIKPNISGENYPNLVGAGDNAVANTFMEYYIDHTDSKVKFVLRNAGTDDTNIRNDTAITAGVWNHLVVTADGSTSTKIYLNGVDNTAGATNNGGFFSDLTGLDNLTLGILEYNGSTLFGPFSGSMDEVAIWDIPISSDSVADLYNGGSGTRADSIPTPYIVTDTGDWEATTKKIGSYSIGPFNGSNDVITVTPSASMDFVAGNPWSWSGWYYPTNVGSYNWLFTQGDASSAMFAHGFGTKIYYGQSTAPNTIQKHTVAGELTLNAWNHIVITCNGDGISSNATTRENAYKVYVNATASTDEATDSNPQLSSGSAGGGTLYMGNRPAGSLGFNGYIDDTAMFNVELDATAIAQLYESGSANVGAKASNVSSSALVGYWDMENDVGTTNVSGGYGQPGTMGGTLSGGSRTTGSLMLYYDFEGGPGTSALVDRSDNSHTGSLTNMDAGGITTLKMYYDFEIGESNPVSGNFPTSTTVYDVVTSSYHGPTAHTGTMTNMDVADFGDWTQGKLGKYSIEFGGNGSDDYIDLPAGAVSGSNTGASGTMAAWVYPTAFSNYEMFFSQGKSTGTTDYLYWGFNGSGEGADQQKQRYVHKVANVQTTWESSDIVPLNAWSHVAVSCDGSSMKFYLNGTQSTTVGTGAKWFADLASDAHEKTGIGMLWYNGSAQFEYAGKIDEFAIWTEALDLGAIQELYNSGAGARANTVSSSVLVSYYDMESSGPGSTTVIDESGNSYDGTFSSAMSSGSCGAG
jgi:hypothetical protein